MQKKVLITGVTGQDGSYMADYLLANTDCVILGAVRHLSVDNHLNIRHINNPRFSLINLDLLDANSIENAIIDHKPDYFINLAAQSFVGKSWDMPVVTWNIDATAVLFILEAIRKHCPRCRYVGAGSSEEFGDVINNYQDETHPLRPRSPYGAAKAAARHLTKVYRESFGLYAIQNWCFNHESPRRGEMFVTQKIVKGAVRITRLLKEGKKDIEPIKLGNFAAQRDWGFAGDYVEAIWMTLNQEIYNPELANIKTKELYKHIKEYVISTGSCFSVADWIEYTFDALQIDGEFVGERGSSQEMFKLKWIGTPLVVSDNALFRPCEVSLLCGNRSAITKDLGWNPKIGFRALIQKMVDAELN